MSGDSKSPSEMPRWIALSQADGRALTIVAREAERAALARRFGIESIGALQADVELARDGVNVSATGRMRAQIVQNCAISGEALPVAIDEPLALRFVPAREDFAEELELEAGDCDEITYQGDRFDLGEAVAQTLALAIDPFATGPDADRLRREVGLEEPERENPFAALRKLRDE